MRQPEGSPLIGIEDGGKICAECHWRGRCERGGGAIHDDDRGRELELAELMVGGAYLGTLLSMVVFLGMQV